MTQRLPNDVFKRPGPHHAFEADMAFVARVRAAIEPLRLLGDVAPIAAVLNIPVDDALQSDRLTFSLGFECIAEGAVDIGLRDYGPLLSRAGLDINFGELLVPWLDARETPISMFWADHEPYLPERVARVRDILPHVAALHQIPAGAWRQVLDEMTPDEEDRDDDDDDPAVLLDQWRVAYIAELVRFERDLRVIAERDGWIVNWSSEQGWL